MYKHLMVAIDGSHNARPALVEAVRIAAATHARLSLVHVVTLHDFAVDSVGLLDSQGLHDEACKVGEAALVEAANYARSQGVAEVKHTLLEAPQGGTLAAEKLANHAADSAADLLVIGTHGHRGWKHLLLGSFAENVLRHVSLPLLVIRNPNDDDHPAEQAG